MRPILSALVLAIPILIALASCGVVKQGAGAGDDGGPSSTSAATSATLGERAVPGYILSAEHLSGITPGQPCSVRVTVTPDAGQPAAASLEVWLGTTAYDPTAAVVAATPVPGRTGVYDVTLDLPPSLPVDATVWLRLTSVDGAVLEVGRDAFPLAAR